MSTFVNQVKLILRNKRRAHSAPSSFLGVQALSGAAAELASPERMLFHQALCRWCSA